MAWWQACLARASNVGLGAFAFSGVQGQPPGRKTWGGKALPEAESISFCCIMFSWFLRIVPHASHQSIILLPQLHVDLPKLEMKRQVKNWVTCVNIITICDVHVSLYSDLHETKYNVSQPEDDSKETYISIYWMFIFRVWGAAPAAQRFLVLLRCTNIVTFMEQTCHYAMACFCNTYYDLPYLTFEQ